MNRKINTKRNYFILITQLAEVESPIITLLKQKHEIENKITIIF